MTSIADGIYVAVPCFQRRWVGRRWHARMHGGPVCSNPPPPAAVLPPPVDGRPGHPSTARMVAPSGLRNMDNFFEFGRTGRRDGAQEEECKCKENQERFPPLGWPLRSYGRLTFSPLLNLAGGDRGGGHRS